MCAVQSAHMCHKVYCWQPLQLLKLDISSLRLACMCKPQHMSNSLPLSSWGHRDISVIYLIHLGIPSRKIRTRVFVT